MRKRLLSLLCVTSLLLTLLPTSVFAADAITGTEPTVTTPESKPTVTTLPAAKTLTYTGKEQELVTAGTADNGTMQYKLDGGAYSTDLPKAMDAGTYTVYYKAVGDESHSDSEEKSVEVTIAKREVTITGLSVKDKVYDGTTAAAITGKPMPNGLLGDDGVSLQGPGTATFDTPDVGTGKPVTISGYTLIGNNNDNAENNYELKKPTGITGTITPAPLTLDQVTAQTRAYVKDDKSVTISKVSCLTSDKSSSNLELKDTDYTATGVMADDKVGDNKDVTVTVELKGDAAKNYRLENATTTTKVTITQADYKGTKETNGFAKFGTEGTVDLSALIVEGGTATVVETKDDNKVLEENSVSLVDKTLNFKFKADAKKDQNAKVTVQVTSDNYKEYIITVNLKVTEKLVQAPLKYTGPSTVTYGQTLQLQLDVTGGSGKGEVTYKSSNNSGTVTIDNKGLLTATRTGEVLIRVDKAGDDTHEGTFVTFTITVTKAPLKIEVANKQIYVGEAVPDLNNPKEGTDYTVTGLVKPEDLKGKAVLKYQKDGKEVTKLDTSKPGVYDITLTGLTTAIDHTTGTHNDYDLKIVPGKLTILAQPSGGGSTGGGSTGGGSTGGGSTGGGSTGGGSSSGGGGGSSSSGKTDKPSASTGKTETTTKPDGTTVKTETRADGTKIQTVTGKDGSTATVKTDKNGKTEAKTKLSDKAIKDAKKKGEAVKAPVEVEATRNSDTAPP